MKIPPPMNPTSNLEFITLNAGEGAFHWIRHLGATDSAGFIFDCGTRSGKSLITRSIKNLKETLGGNTDLALLMVSHYHLDHISGLRTLARPELLKEDKAGGLRAENVWIPAIAPLSMSIYLRMLAFSDLLKYRNRIISEKELLRLFSKKGHLATDISRWFGIPDSSIVRAKAGDVRVFSAGGETISVKALSPPASFNGEETVLSAAAAVILEAASEPEVADALRRTMDEILAVGTPRLFSPQTEQTGEEGRGVPDGFVERMMRIFRTVPEQNSDGLIVEENELLHLWIAISMLVKEQDVPRLSLSKRESRFSPQNRKSLLRLPQYIHDATHLFNLSVEICCGKTSFLLTGDADIALWPSIRSLCSPTQACLQIPHHGSKDNVEDATFKAIACPTYVVSANKYKNWKHPSLPLAEAISAVNGKLFCTNVHGNCQIMNGAGLCHNDIIDAVCVTDGTVEWVVEGERKLAIPCPNLH